MALCSTWLVGSLGGNRGVNGNTMYVKGRVQWDMLYIGIGNPGLSGEIIALKTSRDSQDEFALSPTKTNFISTVLGRPEVELWYGNESSLSRSKLHSTSRSCTPDHDDG